MEDVPVRRRFGRRRAVDPQELVVRTVAEHAEALLRTARRHTSCQDAYQRALEIFVRSAHRINPSTAHRWLHVVVKREAWAVAEARERLVGSTTPRCSTRSTTAGAARRSRNGPSASTTSRGQPRRCGGSSRRR